MNNHNVLFCSRDIHTAQLSGAPSCRGKWSGGNRGKSRIMFSQPKNSCWEEID